MKILKDKDGKVIKTVEGTQEHPNGNRARDGKGRPLSGPYKGQKEPKQPKAPVAEKADTPADAADSPKQPETSAGKKSSGKVKS